MNVYDNPESYATEGKERKIKRGRDAILFGFGKHKKRNPSVPLGT